MRLTELDPRWFQCGGDGISDASGNPVPARHHIGVSFLCPCPVCVPKRTGDWERDFHLRHFISFTNPPDGGPPFTSNGQGPTWQRTGEDWETLQLAPSILSDPAKGGCGWHGYVGLTIPGEVTSC